ncbi:preprotein translocase, YajC subunit [Beutenbergia cavernae DSM 12333]|uniref:Preprotein translocase, YajC subunit n=1 Tax=Beutenbergia cavernae (strain ATCC BAA-8 / DSM 12333 / CCUG 43141 / JCM 11478 / NBRC 16432 / NCIMB 13614 / HKI 0122) TaxID=471853 RepID=C5C5Q9_BEUC1|nr:preprotein translocase subunit YajC [Beutenbergia cavernae]ACQ80250.1 preprotein translocase, YajC subunit [Beutenbergia cavernae DSM 12333]
MDTSQLPLLLILAVAIVGLFFLNSRGRKQQAKQAEFRNNLEVGQDVMTLSGQLGTIVDIEGDTITIESTPGTRTRWVRAAIGKVVEPTEPAEEPETDAEPADPAEPGSTDGPETQRPQP